MRLAQSVTQPIPLTPTLSRWERECDYFTPLHTTGRG